MIHVDPSEQLLISDIKNFCEGKKGVRFVPMEDVREHFLSSQDDPPYVLVSTLSDFSLREQAKHHPNEDIEKLSMRAPWEELKASRDRYSYIKVGPCVREGFCEPSDKYVVKVDSISACTFNEVPDNVVCWFATNLDIRHSRIEMVPFGLNDDGPGASYLPEYMGRPKTELAYANFQNNTVERVRLNRWAPNQPWITWDKPASLPVRDFFDRMSSCKFVLCPFGNGLDCYRTYEALYLGCVPILEDSTFSRYLLQAGLPIVVVPSFYNVVPEMLEEIYAKLLGHREKFNTKVLTKSFWYDRIDQAAAMAAQ